jgi:hypothetical protein
MPGRGCQAPQGPCMHGVGLPGSGHAGGVKCSPCKLHAHTQKRLASASPVLSDQWVPQLCSQRCWPAALGAGLTQGLAASLLQLDRANHRPHPFRFSAPSSVFSSTNKEGLAASQLHWHRILWKPGSLCKLWKLQHRPLDPHPRAPIRSGDYFHLGARPSPHLACVFVKKNPPSVPFRSVPSRLLLSVSLRPDRIAPIDRGPVSSSSVLLLPPDRLLP